MEKFVSTLRRQERFTMRETPIVGKLVKLANSRIDSKKLEEMRSLVKQLKMVEWREQLTASANKVNSRMRKLLKLHMFSPNTRSKLQSLVTQIKIFYGKLMVDTVEGLWKEINRKPVNVVRVRQGVGVVQRDIQALTAVEIELDRTTTPKR